MAETYVDPRKRVALPSFYPNIPLTPSNDASVHVDELGAVGDTVRKTIQVAPALAAETPSVFDKSLQGRVTANTIADLEKTDDKLPSQFPNLAWEALQLGLQHEASAHRKLDQHLKKVDLIQGKISRLLDFSKELTTHVAGEKPSAKMKELTAQLEKDGIEILKDTEEFLSKERISELKSITGEQTQTLRSDLQLSLPRIQALMQGIASDLDTLKEILRNEKKQREAAIQAARHH